MPDKRFRNNMTPGERRNRKRICDNARKPRKQLLADLDKARAVKNRRLIETFWERFWARVELTDKCWNWLGSLNEDGYGQVKDRGTAVMAHRAVYEMCFGAIKEGLLCCHHCDNPRCVNPNHLFVGTNQDNVDDREHKGRGDFGKGEKHYMAKLTDRQVAAIRKRFNGSITIKERNALALKHGMHPVSISNIVYAHRRLPKYQAAAYRCYRINQPIGQR